MQVPPTPFLPNVRFDDESFLLSTAPIFADVSLGAESEWGQDSDYTLSQAGPSRIPVPMKRSISANKTLDLAAYLPPMMEDEDQDLRLEETILFGRGERVIPPVISHKRNGSESVWRNAERSRTGPSSPSSANNLSSCLVTPTLPHPSLPISEASSSTSPSQALSLSRKPAPTPNASVEEPSVSEKRPEEEKSVRGLAAEGVIQKHKSSHVASAVKTVRPSALSRYLSKSAILNPAQENRPASRQSIYPPLPPPTPRTPVHATPLAATRTDKVNVTVPFAAAGNSVQPFIAVTGVSSSLAFPTSSRSTPVSSSAETPSNTGRKPLPQKSRRVARSTERANTSRPSVPTESNLSSSEWEDIAPTSTARERVGNTSTPPRSPPATTFTQSTLPLSALIESTSSASVVCVASLAREPVSHTTGSSRLSTSTRSTPRQPFSVSSSPSLPDIEGAPSTQEPMAVRNDPPQSPYSSTSTRSTLPQPSLGDSAPPSPDDKVSTSVWRSPRKQERVERSEKGVGLFSGFLRREETHSGDEFLEDAESGSEKEVVQEMVAPNLGANRERVSQQKTAVARMDHKSMNKLTGERVRPGPLKPLSSVLSSASFNSSRALPVNNNHASSSSTSSTSSKPRAPPLAPKNIPPTNRPLQSSTLAKAALARLPPPTAISKTEVPPLERAKDFSAKQRVFEKRSSRPIMPRTRPIQGHTPGKASKLRAAQREKFDQVVREKIEAKERERVAMERQRMEREEEEDRQRRKETVIWAHPVPEEIYGKGKKRLVGEMVELA
ncbi:hypothetical protein P7C73_g1150, partial [Tremellales sp. Uapishka_1]